MQQNRTCRLELIEDIANAPGISDDGTPQIYFDQLNHIHAHLHDIAKTKEEKIIIQCDDMVEPMLSTEQVHHIHSILTETNEQENSTSHVNKVTAKLQRSHLKKQDNWGDWEQCEWKQLNQYRDQHMFGRPCRPPKDKGIFNLVWTHYFKTDGTNTKKARCTCDGSTRSGQAHTLDHTYASCIDQNASRIFFALSAIHNHVITGADASNAFAEANGPKQEYYIRPDKAFHNWWTKCLRNNPIPPDFVIPVLCNMQGHPEAPRLWSKHIHSILTTKLGLTPTTHEPCLYTGKVDGHNIFLVRQVDDFAVSAPTTSLGNKFFQQLDEHLIEPLKMQGTINYFNGVNLVQTRNYITVNCKMYLERVFERHGWTQTPASNNKGSIPLSPKVMRELEETKGPTDKKEAKELEKEMGFGYRAAIGELIYAMVTWLCIADRAKNIRDAF